MAGGCAAPPARRRRRPGGGDGRPPPATPSPASAGATRHGAGSAAVEERAGTSCGRPPPRLPPAPPGHATDLQPGAARGLLWVGLGAASLPKNPREEARVTAAPCRRHPPRPWRPPGRPFPRSPPVPAQGRPARPSAQSERGTPQPCRSSTC